MNSEQQKILDRFNTSLDDLDAVLQNLPEEALDWSEKEGEWTINEVLHHLAGDGNVFAFIFERALVLPGSNVFFGAFPGNEVWCDQLDWRKRSAASALELIHAHRKFLSEMVSHFPDRWDNRVNFCNEKGEVQADPSVEGLIIMLTEHMVEHSEMIKKIVNVNQA